jgi:hypothetical protein
MDDVAGEAEHAASARLAVVIGGIGLVASDVVFAAWARKQIVRWGN